MATEATLLLGLLAADTSTTHPPPASRPNGQIESLAWPGWSEYQHFVPVLELGLSGEAAAAGRRPYRLKPPLHQQQEAAFRQTTRARTT
jgi:hypothetical protein